MPVVPATQEAEAEELIAKAAWTTETDLCLVETLAGGAPQAISHGVECFCNSTGYENSW